MGKGKRMIGLKEQQEKIKKDLESSEEELESSEKATARKMKKGLEEGS